MERNFFPRVVQANAIKVGDSGAYERQRGESMIDVGSQTINLCYLVSDG